MENCRENNLINFRVEEKKSVFPYVLVMVYYKEKDFKRNMSKLLNCIESFISQGPEGLKLLFIKKCCTLSEFMEGRVYILLFNEKGYCSSFLAHWTIWDTIFPLRRESEASFQMGTEYSKVSRIQWKWL